MQIWARPLAKYTDGQIANAAEVLPRYHPTWAPTVGEVVAVIDAERPVPAHQTIKRLPRPPADRTIAETNLNKMREVLR